MNIKIKSRELLWSYENPASSPSRESKLVFTVEQISSEHPPVEITLHAFMRHQFLFITWWPLRSMPPSAHIKEWVFIVGGELLRLADHREKSLTQQRRMDGEVGWQLGEHVCPRRSYWFISDVMTRRSWSSHFIKLPCPRRAALLQIAVAETSRRQPTGNKRRCCPPWAR